MSETAKSIPDSRGPFLSVIIPAFNEARRLHGSLGRIIEIVAARDYHAEVVIVDNASSDETKDVVMKFCTRYPFIKYLYEATRGKGAAVRSGILAGRGEYLLVCDADMAVPIEEVVRLLPPGLQHCDVAVGSREVVGAKRHNEPWHRHVMGRIFNRIVRMLILPGLQDTQCGFKCFRREIARDLFSSGRINGWSFDVEILHIARSRGYRITEVPVDWYYKEESKISPLRDTWLMLREIIEILRNSKKGLYNPPEE